MASKAKKSTQRKLTAILCADVVGYSRLMGDDEEATVEAITAYRKVFTSKIKKHRGRVVDAKGDAILAEFASVVDAVSGAMEIQRELAEKNAGLPDDRRMDFRIGVNLGDVIVKDDVIYGDGVNVAARLEALAEPGGVCISRPVHDQVKAKLKLEYEYLGEQEVKNIAEPVRAYRVVERPEPGVDPAEIPPDTSIAPGQQIVFPKTDAPPLERPAKPSIAVLPFANMSGDPEQSYFSDGISEDIITALSKISGIFVIARTSSFTYKGKSVTVQQVGEELGVRYVLEGSVRKAGNRVRITAQLIDAQSGGHKWADHYDRELEDIFAVQDEIVHNIVTELRVTLTEGEAARVYQATPSNMQAYEYFLRGQQAEADGQYSKEGSALIRELYEKAIALDPDYALAYAMLSFAHWRDMRFGWSESIEGSMKLAKQSAEKAIALDNAQPLGHIMQGIIYLLEKQYDRAVSEGERALALGPNLALVNSLYAIILRLSGRPEEAIVLMKTAMRLAPYYPVNYLMILGECYRLTGRLEEAVEALRLSIDSGFGIARPRVCLITALVDFDRMEEAQAEATKLLELEPKFEIDTWAKRALPYKDAAITEQIIAKCHKAGLPE